MKLHLDQEEFKVVIEACNKETGIRADMLEKDYYVTLVLRELAKLQGEGYAAYFRGGTALYKALGRINRFSEDIDITISIPEGMSKNAGKNYLKEFVNRFDNLPLVEDESRRSTHAQKRVRVYDYQPLYVRDEHDRLDRFGRVKIEATSFTKSEPFHDCMIQALIYSHASAEVREVLTSDYGIKGFNVVTQTLERIFVDKLFAAQSCFDEGKYRDSSKHLYDIAIMSEIDDIKGLLSESSSGLLTELIGYKRSDEVAALRSDLSAVKLEDFALAQNLKSADRESLEAGFASMLNIYVFDDVDLMDFDFALGRYQRSLRLAAMYSNYEQSLPVN
ncbi:MAG: nucleotidyl transferase AbiEii/AbiGii toxin family protein [Coriobacteriia bacterium]|nr:nucleotidyl transferase AbiEii/AbiGii toxin family protein [Coriobacteriia bacterium]MCL2537618.1 nucleotidyl transferase AbiEii/AbiGii toxin family protein [Coriobacteriia bacterium]